MKRRNLKKGTGLVLVATISAGMLSGCGGDAFSREKGENSGVPTYTVAIVREAGLPSDFLESGVMKELEEKSGINIEWHIYHSADWAEQKSLLLASGELPDAFLGSNTLNEADVEQNKSRLLELTELINEETMPNLMEVFEKDSEMKQICTDREGKIYGLPSRIPLQPKVCGYSFYINQEWLNNLGLEMPTTYKELEAVLEKFEIEDADQDGDPDNEFAITGSASQSKLGEDLRTILSPFGTIVSRDDNYMGLNGDGEPVFMPAQENYKEAVKWMRSLWEKGIIDPEYFTQDPSMASLKIQAEGGSEVGLISAWTADAGAGVNASQFSLLEPVEGYDGNHYAENMTNTNLKGKELLFTKDCEEPEKLLAWADGFYDELVTLQTNYGSISEGCITDNGDGTYTVNTPEDGTSLDASSWSHSLRSFGPKYMNQEFYDKVILPEDLGDGIKLKEDDIMQKYYSDDKNIGLPTLQYTAEELSQITALGTNIYKYCEAQYAHWVVAGDVEEEWDSYIKQLNDMGLQELVKIHETAYNVYLERMNK